MMKGGLHIIIIPKCYQPCYSQTCCQSTSIRDASVSHFNMSGEGRKLFTAENLVDALDAQPELQGKYVLDTLRGWSVYDSKSDRYRNYCSFSCCCGDILTRDSMSKLLSQFQTHVRMNCPGEVRRCLAYVATRNASSCTPSHLTAKSPRLTVTPGNGRGRGRSPHPP